MRQPHELLKGFPVFVTVPVQWGDQDALGHVNNTVYLRWAESSRIEYLIRIGLWQRLDTERIGPIIASVSCNYRRPVTYPDTVHAGARITAVGNSSFRMEHVIVSAGLNVVVADLDSTLVLLDYATNKPLRVPDEMREAIRTLEQNGPR
jgi:acyl-CoA thioester hydrolase